MGQTLRDIASTLSGDLKSLNLDDRISYRYIISKFQNKIDVFLRQDARSREIFRDLSLWKVIRCVDLEDINPCNCGYIDTCTTLKRSIIEIPDAFNTTYGLLIKVSTIDSNQEIKQIKALDYKDERNREFKLANRLVCWIENKHIYIPDTTIETVKVYIIPKDPSTVDKLNGDLSLCASILDGELSYPPYLIAVAEQEVLKELAGSKQIVEDEKGDDNTNRKNQ